jgi:hypothetical protein
VFVFMCDNFLLLELQLLGKRANHFLPLFLLFWFLAKHPLQKLLPAICAYKELGWERFVAFFEEVSFHELFEEVSDVALSIVFAVYKRHKLIELNLTRPIRINSEKNLFKLLLIINKTKTHDRFPQLTQSYNTRAIFIK